MKYETARDAIAKVTRPGYRDDQSEAERDAERQAGSDAMAFIIVDVAMSVDGILGAFTRVADQLEITNRHLKALVDQGDAK